MSYIFLSSYKNRKISKKTHRVTTNTHKIEHNRFRQIRLFTQVLKLEHPKTLRRIYEFLTKTQRLHFSFLYDSKYTISISG